MRTLIPRKNIHKETWISPGDKTKDQIYPTLVDKPNKISITNVRSVREADCRSDHQYVQN